MLLLPGAAPPPSDGGRAAPTARTLPGWSSRRKDVCGNGEICHPVLLPLVSCFCGHKLFIPNSSLLRNNKKKIPRYKMRFEVIFHPGVDM